MENTIKLIKLYRGKAMSFSGGHEGGCLREAPKPISCLDALTP